MQTVAALFDAARRLALAVLCLAPISLFAVGLPYKVYEHYQSDGRMAGGVPETTGHSSSHAVGRP